MTEATSIETPVDTKVEIMKTAYDDNFKKVAELFDRQEARFNEEFRNVNSALSSINDTFTVIDANFKDIEANVTRLQEADEQSRRDLVNAQAQASADLQAAISDSMDKSTWRLGQMLVATMIVSTSAFIYLMDIKIGALVK